MSDLVLVSSYAVFVGCAWVFATVGHGFWFYLRYRERVLDELGAVLTINHGFSRFYFLEMSLLGSAYLFGKFYEGTIPGVTPERVFAVNGRLRRHIALNSASMLAATAFIGLSAVGVYFG